MGLMKFAARKGAVGGTARWVADRFLEAIAHQLIDTKNCQTSEGIQQEILKIVDVSLQSRFYSDPSHPDKDSIMSHYKRVSGPGLAGFTVAILEIEADFGKNTPDYQNTFMEVIHEELVKKGVGDVMIDGQLN